MSFADTKNLQRIVFASTTGFIRRGDGVITSSTGSASVTGASGNFLTTMAVGYRIYDMSYRLVGTVSAIADDNTLTLGANALLALTSSAYIVATSTPTDYGFEVRDMTVGMSQKVRTWEIVDESIEQSVISVRPTFQFSTPYLRRSASGTYDFTDVTADMANPAKRVYVLLPDVQSLPVEVVSSTPNYGVSVQRQFIKPQFDFACIAKSPLTAIPSWYKYTKNKPGYFP